MVNSKYMAQGKAWDKEKVIEVLKPIFKLGYSVTKACRAAGIPQPTVATWMEEDEELRLKIHIWQDEPNLIARKNWIRMLKEGADKSGRDFYTPSKDWLERREKDDFSTRNEQTGKDGKDLIPVFEVSTKEAKDKLETLYHEGSSSTNS